MINVRLAQPEDLTPIVKIHLERFSGFFLTNLGESFLETFYAAFLKNPGVLLVIEDDTVVKGFTAGSRDNRGFYKKLLINNLIGFIISGLKILFSKPKALLRIASNSRKSQKSDLIFAELLSIATVENKSGYGKTLLSEFEKEIAKGNIEKLPLSLTTDFDENSKVVDFYKESGYEVHHVFESYQNRKMYRFIKHIN